MTTVHTARKILRTVSNSRSIFELVATDNGKERWPRNTDTLRRRLVLANGSCLKFNEFYLHNFAVDTEFRLLIRLFLDAEPVAEAT
jgi:hypothetical protein